MKYRLKFFVGILLMFQVYKPLAQDEMVNWDSLELSCWEQAADTNTVMNLNRLFDYYSSNGNKPAMPYIERAWHLADSLSYPKGLALTTLNLAIAHDIQGNYYQAFKSYQEALQLAGEIGNNDYRSRCLLSLGYFYSTQGSYEKAIECTREAALLEQEMYGVDAPANAWSNLGFCYLKQQQFDSALFYTQKSYEIFKVEQDSTGLGDVFFNLGNLAWEADKNAAKALNYCLKAKKMYEGSSFRQVEPIAECLAQIGFFYTQQKSYQEADLYLNEALEIAKENDLRYITKRCYSYKAALHEATGNHSKAYDFLRRYLIVHDSLKYQQSSIAIQQLQNEYDLETQQAKISILKQDRELRQEELSRQLLIRNGFIAMVGMLLVLAGVLYRNNAQKQKSNHTLTRQKDEIEEKNKAILRKNQMLQEQKRAMLIQSRSLHEANQQISRQKETIEQKNKDITDSLNYARRIQCVMLPEVAQLQKRISDAFVWLKPRDIVTGDFFWFFDEQNDKLFIAAVDCTGHGVPGAFMSLIGDRYLSEIVKVEKEYEPDRILARLNEHVFHVLKQDKSDNQDGMEMSVCVIDRAKKELYFAGARSHLFYVQDEQLHKIKGDRYHVGGKSNQSFSGFTRHTIKINRPTKFYLYTDGIRDQFGGAEDKKFGEKQLTSLLLELSQLPMARQHMLIQSKLEEWMEGYEQIDDILVIGWSLE